VDGHPLSERRARCHDGEVPAHAVSCHGVRRFSNERECTVTKVTRSLAIAAGTVSVLMTIGGGMAQAAVSTASTQTAARVVCNAPGTGNTTVWGKCWNNGNKTGKARLVYWCKNMIGNGSKQHSTGWKSVKPGKTVKFVGECTFKARNPAFHIG
jgi:hypothetical protein